MKEPWPCPCTKPVQVGPLMLCVNCSHPLKIAKYCSEDEGSVTHTIGFGRCGELIYVIDLPEMSNSSIETIEKWTKLAEHEHVTKPGGNSQCRWYMRFAGPGRALQPCMMIETKDGWRMTTMEELGYTQVDMPMIPLEKK